MNCTVLTARRRWSPGFSLLELLVVIFVIGVLIVLLLPAVQSARESARRTACQNNQKQIGLAISQYASTNGVIPEGTNGNRFSLHSMVLPYLENTQLYNSINFVLGSDAADSATTAYTRMTIFLCPTDLEREEGGPGRTNYAGNGGYNVAAKGFNGLFANPSLNRHVVDYSAITDGLSTTAAMAEWVVGQEDEENPSGMIFKTEFFNDANEFDAFVTACMNLAPSADSFGRWTKPAVWIRPGFNNTIMNHNLTINQHSCLNGASLDLGAWTAGSRHLGGANVLFADGHIRFVRQEVSLEIWRNLATRNGGEIIPSDAY